ncbi:p97 [Cichlidogyrus casuarinus]|uniref:P97 n=1 Tax=Cichlidogyrus casuarinus TaxID=1844966 RepID=A0ABD2QGM8_9PLAT
MKCLSLSNAIQKASTMNTLYNLTCVQGRDEFDCMKIISEFNADLMNLDAGLGFYASRRYSLRPIAVESYNEATDIISADLTYYANIIVPKSKGNLDPYLLRSEEICFSGAGMADGYVMQLSKLIGEMNALPVTQCNSVVQNLIKFLGDSCLPGSLNEIFNPFGGNTEEICKLCANKGYESYCTYSDRYARNQGALQCLLDHNNNPETKYKPIAAFVRAQEIDLAAEDNFPINDYQLLCPNKGPSGAYIAPLTNFNSCHWGEIPSRMIMTSLTRLDPEILRSFLIQLGKTFTGVASTFKLFSSSGYNSTNIPYPTKNLMFSDFTRGIVVPTNEETSTYDRWIPTEFMQAVEKLNQCPLPTTRWCVIDEWEMNKCQKMRSAFSVKGIKPDLDCILANSTNDCMHLIKDGYVDMVNLEAGDLYTAGKYFGLVPIISENYGLGPYYYAVAVVRKINPILLISNWKFTLTCHSGVGKATGWVIPLNIILNTVQVRVLNGQIVYALGELVSRACVPGVLDLEYNPDLTNPLNLCEVCVGGNSDRCQRDNRELYFGDTGAFRCLVEGGDIAFTRHTTVHSNTADRNRNYWARNQREDNYELLCADGQRKDVSEWKTCHLSRVPGHTIVTAPHKTEEQRNNMWFMLQYGQEYYSSDRNEIFALFDSDFYHKDLIFSDETESLKLIKWENQDYIKWLGPEFLRLIENVEAVAKGTPSGVYNQAASTAVRVFGGERPSLDRQVPAKVERHRILSLQSRQNTPTENAIKA